MAREGEEALSADSKRKASPKQRTQQNQRVLVDGGDMGNRHDTQKIKVGTTGRRRQMGGAGAESKSKTQVCLPAHKVGKKNLDQLLTSWLAAKETAQDID